MVHIYALRNPLNGQVFYVGKANDATNRLKHHLKPTRMAKAIPKNDYIKKHILSLGAEPELIILEECSPADWREREQHWISLFKSQGHTLYNDTAGGEGPNKFRLK